MPRTHSAGVTLVELMIVVVIVAVLAVIGVTSYAGYQRRARANEALANVGLIAAAQEAYKAEFGTYANVNQTNPASITCGQTGTFDTSTGADPGQSWNQLGWRPENLYVAFKYLTNAGTSSSGVPSWADSLVTNHSLGWFTIEATGNLSCRTSDETTYRMVNGRTNVIRLNEFE